MCISYSRLGRVWDRSQPLLLSFFSSKFLSFKLNDLEITDCCKVSDPLLSCIDQSSFILNKPNILTNGVRYYPKGIFPRATFQVTFSQAATSQMGKTKWQFPKVLNEHLSYTSLEKNFFSKKRNLKKDFPSVPLS